MSLSPFYVNLQGEERTDRPSAGLNLKERAFQ